MRQRERRQSQKTLTIQKASEKHEKRKRMVIKRVKMERDNPSEETYTAARDVIWIISFDVIKEQILRSILFQFITFGNLSKGFVSSIFFNSKELTCFHPFIPSNMTIMIQVQQIECCVNTVC